MRRSVFEPARPVPGAPSHTSGRRDVHGVPYTPAQMSEAMTSKNVGLTFLASALGIVVLAYLFGVSLATLCVAIVVAGATAYNVLSATIREFCSLRQR